LPAAETAVSVIGEVLVADGLAFEVLGKDGLDFRKRVEPRQENGAGLAIGKATVDLFADFRREVGDFSGHKEVQSSEFKVQSSEYNPDKRHRDFNIDKEFNLVSMFRVKWGGRGRIFGRMRAGD
jgi:hypothetical protein